MSTDKEQDDLLPSPPRKLADRIANLTDDSTTDDLIVGDGEFELRSEHPVRVVEAFLIHHVDDWANWTFKDYSYDLTRFLEYCEYAEKDNLANLSSGDLVGFRQWRKRDGNIGLASLHGQLANIRVFLRWCEQIEIIEDGLGAGMELPDLDPSDIVSYARLKPSMASQIIDYNEGLGYVTREFAEFCVIWACLCRLGDLRALDVDDYDREEGYIDIKHKPHEETPLKNGSGEVSGAGGERQINLPDWVCSILNLYIDGSGDPNHPKRNDKKGKFGRTPLFTTKFGRVSPSTLRRDLYRITQPCRHGQECPHEKNPDSCGARNDNKILSQCPSNTSPHPVRRGGICYQLKQGISKDTICERADVSRRVLNKHYDLRTKEEARQQRRNELRSHLDGYEPKVSGESAPPDSIIEQEVPLVSDIHTGVSRALDGQAIPSMDRAIKGILGYACFITLLGIDFGLMGIGI